MVETTRNNQRTISNTAQKSPSVHGDQPRSLHVNWMKYDVTKENINPNCSVHSAPTTDKSAQPSPLRQRLQAKGDAVMKKRQLLTLGEIEAKIDEARLRKDFAKADALSNQILARMNRALASKIKHAYLLEKANLRHQAEETKSQYCDKSLASIKQREQQVQLKRVKADDQADRDSSAVKGLTELNQMNVDLEDLIREVYQKIKAEEGNQRGKRQTIEVAQ